MSRPLTLQEIRNRILKFHVDIVSLDETTYRGLRIPAKFIDKEFGGWWCSPYSVITGHGNPKRGYIKNGQRSTLPIDIIKKRLMTVYGDMVIIDESTYVNTSTKARFIDKEYGEWSATPFNVLGGHKHESRSRIESAPKISATRKRLIASGEIDKWSWLKLSKFEHTDIEVAIEEELKNRSILFETQKVLFNKFMPDFVNEEYKIVVFADGCYWHGCLYHNTGFKKASRRQSIDKSQNIYLTKCDYKVFRFWEHEIKKDVKACVDQIEFYIKGLL